METIKVIIKLLRILLSAFIISENRLKSSINLNNIINKKICKTVFISFEIGEVTATNF